MSGKQGAETRLTLKMRKAAEKHYGDRLVVVKYVGGLGAEVGVSDLFGSLDGVSFFCEVKSPESSTHKRKTVEASIAHALEHGPTVKQRLFVARVLRSGGCAGFAATIEQFMEQLAHAEAMAEGGHTGTLILNHQPHCPGHNC